jgi:hypothetical protein
MHGSTGKKQMLRSLGSDVTQLGLLLHHPAAAALDAAANAGSSQS